MQHVALARLADLDATIMASAARLGPADKVAIAELVLQEVLDRVRGRRAGMLSSAHALRWAVCWALVAGLGPSDCAGTHRQARRPISF